MTTVDHGSASITSAMRPALPLRAVAYISGLLRAWHNRQAFIRLGEMSDYELADIGLTRTDLQLPWRIDPTAELAPLARTRIEAAARVAARGDSRGHARGELSNLQASPTRLPPGSLQDCPACHQAGPSRR